MKKGIVIALMAAALAFAFVAGAVEIEKDVKMTAIELTNAQITAIKNANGKDVVIKLTKKQINAIKAKAPGYKGSNELTLNSTHVSPDNEITIEFSGDGKTLRFTSTPPNSNKTPVSK